MKTKILFLGAALFCLAGFAQAQAPCLNESVNTFSGTSGAVPTPTTLQGTQFGDGSTWQVFNSTTYQTAAYYPIPDPTGVLCGTSLSYSGSASTTGIQIAGSGTNTEKGIRQVWSGNAGISQVSVSAWFCPVFTLSTYSGANSFAIDYMLIGSTGGDYANFHGNAANGLITVQGESPAEAPQNDSPWGSITIPVGTGCGVGQTSPVLFQLYFGTTGSACTNGSGGAAPCHYLRILNYQGAPLACTGSTIATSCADGHTIAFPSEGTNTPNSLTIGNLGNQDLGGVGNFEYYNWPVVDFTGTFPVPHSCIATGLTVAAMNTALGNCLTGGYVDLPQGSGTWGSVVATAQTGPLTIQGQTAMTPSGTPGTSTFAIAAADNTFTCGTSGTCITLTVDSAFSPVVSANTYLNVNNITWISDVSSGNGTINLTPAHLQQGFRFHHNHVVNLISGSYELGTTGGNGLFDYNWIDDETTSGQSGTPFKFNGDHVSLGYQGWSDPTVLGSNQSVIAENNYLTFKRLNGGEGAFDGYNGCKVTFRYNYIGGTIGNEIGGYHGTDTSQSRGCIYSEVYNNYALNNSGGTLQFENPRSGTTMFFNNDGEGSSPWSTVQLQYDRYNFANTATAQYGLALPGLNWVPVDVIPGSTCNYGPGHSTDCVLAMTLNAPDWIASHAYAANATIGPTSGSASNQNYLNVGGACTSAGSRPSFISSTFGGSPVADNTCSWENVGGVTNASVGVGAGADGFQTANPDTACSSNAPLACGRFWDGNGGVYPYRDQPSVAHNQVRFPTYAWSNKKTGTLSTVIGVDAAITGFVVQNLDWFDYQTAGCTGTQSTGVCVGVAASMPACSGTGAGYWQTDTSKLFTCQSGTFVLYYQPYVYPASGIATGCVTLSPTSNSFGSFNVGIASPNVTFTLTSTCSGSTTGVSITLTGTNPSDFNQQSTSCASTLAASSSCNIVLFFKPTASGGRSATLQVTDSDISSPQTSALSGTGLFSLVPVGPSLSFGLGF